MKIFGHRCVSKGCKISKHCIYIEIAQASERPGNSREYRSYTWRVRASETELYERTKMAVTPTQMACCRWELHLLFLGDEKEERKNIRNRVFFDKLVVVKQQQFFSNIL